MASKRHDDDLLDEQPRRQRPVFGRALLPKETYRTTCYADLGTALYWGMAHSWKSLFGLYGPSSDEDPRVRLLVSTTKPAVALIEMNSITTSNMLDPILTADFFYLFDSYYVLCQRRYSNREQPLAVVLQGVGPHFCPGGNHHPVNPPGATPWTMTPYSSNSLFAARLQEISIPVVTAMTGSAIGGGVAVSVNTTARVAAQNSSFCFGNLSRGACPLMFLSKNLPSVVGLATAMSIYLTDSTMSASAALKARLISEISISNAATKNKAFQTAFQLAGSQNAQLLGLVHPTLCHLRYTYESLGFTRCSVTGQMTFQDKRATASSETALVLRGPRVEVGGSQSSVDADKLEHRRPRAVQRVLREDLRANAEDADSEGSGRKRTRRGQPKPFPLSTDAPASFCVQCGSKGFTGGTLFRGQCYCDHCRSLLGLNSENVDDEAQNLVCSKCLDARDLVRFGNSFQCKMCGPNVGVVTRGRSDPLKGEVPFCATCGQASRNGRFGVGMYARDFYCSRCWQKWRDNWLSEMATEAGTDQTHDSGTEGTIVDSDNICVTSASELEV